MTPAVAPVPAPAPAPVDSNAGRRAGRPPTPLPNLLFVAPRVLSGGEPSGPIAFRALAALGVRTAVCVDGRAPDAEAAAAVGVRVVHVPIGYDEVPEAAQATIARAIRDLDGPIYVYCHHGHHRGPAAVAAALRRLDRLDAAAANEFLIRAGTSERYPGLWRSVAEATVWPAERLEALAPLFVAAAPVNDLAGAMARLDRHWDQLGRLAGRAWRPDPGHPDLAAAAEAGIVADVLRLSAESVRDAASTAVPTGAPPAAAAPTAFADPAEPADPASPTGPSARLAPNDPALAAELEAAAHLAARLESVLADPDMDLEKANALYGQLGRSCRSCHARWRDGAGPPSLEP